MKNIMLSIRPEWLQKILSGQKTVELRLSRPNLTPPFMVFLYCSCKGSKKPGEILEIHSGGKIYKANGLVVGEFTCTEIDRVVRVGYMGSNAPLQYCVNAQPGNYTPAGKLYEDACLTVKQAEDYVKMMMRRRLKDNEQWDSETVEDDPYELSSAILSSLTIRNCQQLLKPYLE